jgi:hypothetical protein
MVDRCAPWQALGAGRAAPVPSLHGRRSRRRTGAGARSPAAAAAIAVVDGEPAVRAAAGRDLRRAFGERYRIVRVGSGDEALGVARPGRPGRARSSYGRGPPPPSAPPPIARGLRGLPWRDTQRVRAAVDACGANRPARHRGAPSPSAARAANVAPAWHRGRQPRAGHSHNAPAAERLRPEDSHGTSDPARWFLRKS